MVTVGILVVLFGSHVLGTGLHILGALALFVGSLFPGSALLAVHIAALGVAVLRGVAHIVHAIHAVFVFHDFFTPFTLAKVVCADQRGIMRGIFYSFSSRSRRLTALRTGHGVLWQWPSAQYR